MNILVAYRNQIDKIEDFITVENKQAFPSKNMNDKKIHPEWFNKLLKDPKIQNNLFLFIN